MREHVRRLARGSSIYGLGALFPKIIGFVLIPVYAHWLKTAEYGILTMVATIHSVLYVLLEMGLGYSVLRYYVDLRERPDELKRFLGSVQFFLFGANLVVLGVLVAFGERIFGFLLKDPSLTFRPYILLGVLTTYFALGSIVPLEVYRVREQAGRYVGFQGAYLLLSALAIIVAVVWLGKGVVGALWARLLVTVAFCAVYWIVLLPRIRAAFSTRHLGEALRYGLPLVPMAVANWVLTASDRVLLERFTTLEQVGVYGMGYTIGMIMGDVVRSVHKAYVPYFFDTAKREADAPRVLAGIGLVYLVFVSAIALVGVLFCREGVLLLTTPAYHAAARVVPFVVVAYLFHGLYYMTVSPLYYLKKTGVLSVATVLGGALNVGLNLWWIPRFGMMGAAYSTLAAYAATFVVVFAYVQRVYPVPYDARKAAAVLVLFACAAAAGLVPAWHGVVVPLAVKTLVVAAFGGGLVALRVARWSDVAFLLSRDKGAR